MATNYGNPYQYGQPQPNEVNPNGDSANGTYGSYSNNSVMNAGMQRPQKSGGNPFADMLDHAMSWSRPMNQQQPNTPFAANQPTLPLPSGNGDFPGLQPAPPLPGGGTDFPGLHQGLPLPGGGTDFPGLPSPLPLPGGGTDFPGLQPAPPLPGGGIDFPGLPAPVPRLPSVPDFPGMTPHMPMLPGGGTDFPGLQAPVPQLPGNGTDFPYQPPALPGNGTDFPYLPPAPPQPNQPDFPYSPNMRNVLTAQVPTNTSVSSHAPTAAFSVMDPGPGQRDDNGSGGTAGGGAPSTPPGTTPPPTNTGSVIPNPAGTRPQGQSRTAGFTMNWSKVPGYEWLGTQQGLSIASEYLKFLDDNKLAGEGGMTQAGAVDFPDWLKNTHTELANADPMYRRAGSDTYTDWLSKQNKTTGTNDQSGNRLGNTNPPTTQSGTSDDDAYAISLLKNAIGVGGVDYAKQLYGSLYEKYKDKLGTTDTTTLSTTPPTTTPPGAPAPQPPGGPNVDFPGVNGDLPPQAQGGKQQLIDQLRSLFGPQFQQEQSDFARALRAQGALTGDINSGGFAQSMANGLSRLTADEGSRLSNYLQQANLASQQFDMQKYQIDSQKAVAEMQDATTRLGIKTNDDLQRWLNSPESNTLQKYGIDKNDLLERYKAQIQLQAANAQASGQAAMASAQFNAEAMRVAMEKEIAQKQLDAQIANQHNQNDLSWAGLQLQNQGQIGNFILGMLGMGGGSIQDILSSLNGTWPTFTGVFH